MTGRFTPLIPRDLRLEVPERLDSQGRVLTPLAEEQQLAGVEIHHADRDRDGELGEPPHGDELLDRLPWPGSRRPTCVYGPYAAGDPCAVAQGAT